MTNKLLLKQKKRVLAIRIDQRNHLEKQLKNAFKFNRTKVIFAAHRELERLDNIIQKLQMEIIILKEKIRQGKHRKG